MHAKKLNPDHFPTFSLTCILRQVKQWKLFSKVTKTLERKVPWTKILIQRLPVTSLLRYAFIYFIIYRESGKVISKADVSYFFSLVPSSGSFFTCHLQTKIRLERHYWKYEMVQYNLQPRWNVTQSFTIKGDIAARMTDRTTLQHKITAIKS